MPIPADALAAATMGHTATAAGDPPASAHTSPAPMSAPGPAIQNMPAQATAMAPTTAFAAVVPIPPTAAAIGHAADPTLQQEAVTGYPPKPPHRCQHRQVSHLLQPHMHYHHLSQHHSRLPHQLLKQRLHQTNLRSRTCKCPNWSCATSIARAFYSLGWLNQTDASHNLFCGSEAFTATPCPAAVVVPTPGTPPPTFVPQQPVAVPKAAAEAPVPRTPLSSVVQDMLQNCDGETLRRILEECHAMRASQSFFVLSHKKLQHADL